MTARPQDVALLQLPALEPELEDLHPGLKGFIYMYARDYARANITAALASAQVREDELRAELIRIERENREGWKQAAHWRVRAERLEEALRAARQKVYMGELPHGWTIDRIDAALSTNAATQTGETNGQAG